MLMVLWYLRYSGVAVENGKKKHSVHNMKLQNPN